ncbi:MAG: hypothetical protein JSV67_00830 [Thermoplasmatales archaeon]|nr:MAG: hypothetical protein JSV67_00830 [Thermoplasmatales archaeon]
MAFNLKCEHLINKPPVIRELISGGKATTKIRNNCDAQHDELDNLIPINKCPIDCPLFELKTS